VTVEVGANSELWCHIHDRCQDFPQGAQKSLNNLTIMSGEHNITSPMIANSYTPTSRASCMLLQLLGALCFSLHWSKPCFSNPFSCTSNIDSEMCQKHLQGHYGPLLNVMQFTYTPSYLWLWLFWLPCKMMMSFPKSSPGSSKISQQLYRHVSWHYLCFPTLKASCFFTCFEPSASACVNHNPAPPMSSIKKF
jgi:hypothetical protein